MGYAVLYLLCREQGEGRRSILESLWCGFYFDFQGKVLPASRWTFVCFWGCVGAVVS